MSHLKILNLQNNDISGIKGLQLVGEYLEQLNLSNNQLA